MVHKHEHTVAAYIYVIGHHEETMGTIFAKLNPNPLTSFPFFLLFRKTFLNTSNSRSTLTGCELVDQIFELFKK